MPIDPQEIQRRFGFHPATDTRTANAHDDVRQGCAQLADVIVQATPECREQSLALTALEETMFYANAAIARPAAAPRPSRPHPDKPQHGY